MAKVFLRTYNREIESMIEGGQLYEAVAHCQYILKTFPMHVDTYRLLGKAFLEARRYADAADIFQRVLMAVPDDFVSHVGMSIIRDDENKMDDAIWHMERAFEVQPSNSAIQGELRRLYGRRDGVEPSKIRLSRDALANMYSQGELFNQAIAEIRSVLAEDANRPDLQVMLARAYYRSGQKVEAAEMAAGLLHKYPYCMDSLRVLVEVLPGTARAENTQVYRQRLHSLDPYSSFTVNSVFASDQVADSAVNLERLEYKSGPTTISSQPDWASSLGIKLNDEKEAGTPPAWMQTAETQGQLGASTPEQSGSEVEPAPVTAADSVPEWMRSAGWQESDKEAQVGSPDSGESSSDETIAKADIPDWLKSMAPKEATEEINPEPDESAEALPLGVDGIPDWLKPTDYGSTVGKTPLEAQQPNEPLPDNATGIPDRLKSLTPAVATGVVHAETQQIGEPQQAKVEPQPQDAEEIPDWLKPLAPADTAGEVPPIALHQPVEPQKANAEPQAEGMVATPDTPKTETPTEAVEEVNAEALMQPVEPQQAPLETQPVFADGLPEWLKSMAPGETINEVRAEAPVEPDEPQQANAEPQGEGAVAILDTPKTETTTEAGEEVQAEGPVQPVEPQKAPFETQPVFADGFPDWLKSMAPAETVDEVPAEAQQPDEPEQAPVEPDTTSADEVPDWLKSMALEEAIDEVHVEGLVQPVKPEQALAEPDTTSADEVADWLKSMAPVETVQEVPAEAQQPIASPKAPVEPEAVSADEVPVWLKSMALDEATDEAHVEAPVQPVEPQQAPVESQPVSADEVPDWIKPSDSTESVGEVPAETRQPIEPQQALVESQLTGADDVLDWLKSLDSTESAGGLPVNSPQKPIEPQLAPVEPGPASATGVPDWFKSLTTVKAVEEVPAEVPPPPVEPQTVGVDATPDWLKPLDSAEEPGEVHVETPQPPVETITESEEVIPDWLNSKAPAETNEVSKDISEIVPVEPTSVISEPGSIPAETPSLKTEAFPDWLTGMSSRADAAALAAKKIEQPETSEPPAQASVNLPIPPEASSAESFQPTGEVKPLNIGDDAFSWLESLAAKQGARPEELLTNPEERSGEMPDWLRQPGEKPADAPVLPAPELINTSPETLPLEPQPGFDKEPASKPAHTLDEVFPVKDENPSFEGTTQSVVQPVDQPVSGKDETIAWLETLSEEQGTKPEEPLVTPVADLSAPPDWIQKVEDDRRVGPAAEEVIPATPEPAPAQEDISITSRLSKVDVDNALGTKSDEIPADATLAAPSEELPNWLKDFEKPANSVEAPITDYELPEWLRHPVPSESPEPVAPAPVLDSASEPELPSWVDENISVNGPAAPTMPEEWLPAEIKSEGISNPLPPVEPTSVPVPSNVVKTVIETPQLATAIPQAESSSIPVKSPDRLPTLKQTGMLSHIPALDKDAELLSGAQDVLDQNSLDDAMQKYTKLIKKGRLLDEVIHDLREAIYRYPVDVIIWQTLGDAYMRTNRLQDALDAYTKAEELLR